MITNLNLYNNITGNNVLGNNISAITQGTIETSQASVTNTDIAKNNVENEVANVAPNNNIYLSDRSQKISNISQEFFSGGQLTFDDIGRLKDKLYQFGLISKNEHVSLTGVNETSEQQEVNEKISTITLSHFIGDFIERLNSDKKESKTDEEQPAEKSEAIIVFTKALTTAQEILNNVEDKKGEKDFKANLKESMSVIKSMINDESFAKLPLDDQTGLSKIHQALEIVDSLSPQRLNNAKVNQYIALSLR